MSAKTLFQSKTNEALRSWWTAVARDERFEHVLMFARSDFVETNPDATGLAGAASFLRTLKGLAEAEDSTQDILSVAKPGLIHKELPARHEHQPKQTQKRD